MFHTVGSCNASSHHLPHCPTRSNHDANFNSATLFVPSFPSSPFLPGITMCCHHELLLPPLLETRGWSRRMGEEKWSKERWIHRRRYVFKRRGELLPLPVFIVHRLSVEDFLLCRKEIILLLPRILLSQPIGFFNYRSRARTNLQIFEEDRSICARLKEKRHRSNGKDRKREKLFLQPGLLRNRPGWNIGNFIPGGETERTREGRLCGPVFSFNKGDAQ